MAIKRINLTDLLENGKMLNSCDLIVDYRYRILTDKPIVVSVWGESEDEGYFCLGHKDLYRPNDERIPITYTKDLNTDIFTLKQTDAVGIFVFIENAEYVEIKRVEFTFTEAGKTNGRSMDCGPYYPPYPETGYVVNPFVFANQNMSVLFNVNAMSFIEIESYNVTPMVFTDTVSYAVNQFAFCTIEGVNVNPFVLSLTTVFNVNPFVIKEENAF